MKTALPARHVRRAGLLSLVMAAAGMALIMTGQAATMTSVTEAEAGTMAAPASMADIAGASGGRGVRFGAPTTGTRYGCTVSGATGATATRQVPATGATPDDGNDDYQAIQSAIDTAGNGGGVVTLPAGTFIIDGHLYLKSNVRLQGAGPATVIKAGPQFFGWPGKYGGYPVISTGFGSNVTIAGLTVDASGDTLDGNVDGRLTEYVVDIREGANIVIEDVHTRNPYTYSIVANNTSRFCIRDSSTRSATNGRYDQLDGIHVLNSHTGDVVNNDVDQKLGTDGDDGLVAHTMDGGEVVDITYAGNKVRGGRHGAHMQFAYSSPQDRIRDIRVVDNYFYGHVGIHTGAFGGSGSVESVLIERNSFVDTPEFSVHMDGTLRDVVVRDNRSCNSGGYIVGPGTGNSNQNNTTDACALIVRR